MIIGVRAHDYGRHEIYEYADLLSREGYQAVQLAIPKAFTGIETYESITETILYQIKDAFSQKKISIVVLGCYQDLSNPNDDIRNQSIKNFQRSLLHAKILNAKLVGTETAYAHLSRQEKKLCFPYMMESLKQLTEDAERLETCIGIEPVAWHPLENVDVAREVIEKLGSQYVKIIFDPVNVLENPALVNQKDYWKECLQLIGKKIEVVHIKDFVINQKGEYESRLLGQGCMNFDELAVWLKMNPQIPIIREEMNPQTAKFDRTFMQLHF